MKYLLIAVFTFVFAYVSNDDFNCYEGLHTRPATQIKDIRK